MEFPTDFANWNSILGRAGRDEEAFNRLLQGLIALFESTVMYRDHKLRPDVVGHRKRTGHPLALLRSDIDFQSSVSARASLVTAQTSTPRRTAWDGVYTEAQATRGMMAFDQSCAGCHALGAEGVINEMVSTRNKKLGPSKW